MNSVKERIKYFGNNDGSIPYYLRKVHDYVLSFNSSLRNINTINEIIELYIINKYHKAGHRLEEWNEDFLNQFGAFCKETQQIIGRYVNQINDDNISGLIEEVDAIYREEVWDLIAYYNVQTRITGETIDQIIKKYPRVINSIIRYEKLVKEYDSFLATAMIRDVSSAELLMTAKLTKRINQTVFLPESLTPEDCQELITRYINSADCNPNYLSLLMNSSEDETIGLNSKVKLAAGDRYVERMEEIAQPGAGFGYGFEVQFCDMDLRHQGDCVVYYTDEENITHITYDKKWIEENLDYPTLLNNFIYLFGFVDLQNRCLFTSVESKMSAVERSLGIKGRDYYIKGVQFDYANLFTSVNMQAYYYELLSLGVRLEDIFKWFFETYLPEEFNANGFVYNIPTEDMSWMEKCRTVASEMDSILKQFSQFVEEGQIDRRLFEISSKPIAFNCIPSFINKKYAYLSGKNVQSSMLSMFSDQSVLSYYVPKKKSYKSFYELLINETVTIEQLEQYQQSEAEMLLSQGYIGVDCKGRLFNNENKIRALKEMYDNDVICVHYMKKYKKQIEELELEKELVYETRLLSRPEQNLFDYLLKSKYSNGLALRNRYVHGTYSIDEKRNANDYITMLKLMAVIIIKINEEFVLRDLDAK